MRKFLVILLTALFVCVSSSPTYAWNKPGHMVTATIAYQELKEFSPGVLSRVIELLNKHPYFQSDWQVRINSVHPDDTELFLFMLAARWPDDIRGTSLHCEQCHFINFPFKPMTQPSSVITQPPAVQSVISAFKSKMNLIRSNATDKDKAMALAWVFHVIGDVHQPLHTTALFTKIFPQGDRGGTRFFIRVQEDSGPISLHQFWDDLILGSDRFQSVRNRATELRLRADLRRSSLSELSEKNFDKWAKLESFSEAVKIAYLNGNLDGSPDEHDSSLLPSGYISEAKKLAERRIVLAGYRLADTLKDLFGGN